VALTSSRRGRKIDTRDHGAGVWILPLFPASPTRPVYQNISTSWPLDFPLLVIVGAYAMDLVRDLRQLAARRACTGDPGCVSGRARRGGVAVRVVRSSMLLQLVLFGSHYVPYSRIRMAQVRGTFCRRPMETRIRHAAWPGVRRDGERVLGSGSAMHREGAADEARPCRMRARRGRRSYCGQADAHVRQPDVFFEATPSVPDLRHRAHCRR